MEPWSEQSRRFAASQEIMLPMGWGADYADPDNFMYTFYSSGGFFYPTNNWKDAQVDAWLEQARATVDAAQRGALYRKVADRASELSPFIVLPADQNVRVFRSNLRGVSKATYNPLRAFGFTGTLWKDLSKK